MVYLVYTSTSAVQTSQLSLLQRSLSSLALPMALSVANGAPSENLSSSVPLFENSERLNGTKYYTSPNTSEYSGRRKHKSHDPARDLSLQVLEKFSLVTKFARETTSHIFRENQGNSFDASEKKQQKQSPALTPTTSKPSEEQSHSNDAVVEPDPLEVLAHPSVVVFRIINCN